MTEKRSGNVSKQTGPVRLPAKSNAAMSSAIVVGCTLIAIISGSIGVGGLASILSGTALKGGVVGNVGALLIFTGVTILFGWVARRNYKQMTALTELERERAILAYAKQQGTALTIPDFALNCAMTITEAASVLNKLTARGVCQMDVSEEGELLYCFTSFQRKHISSDGESLRIKNPQIQKEQS